MPEESSQPIRNVALLIDADNASPDTLDPVLTVLAELGTVNIRRAYGNWEKPALKGWAKIVHLHAIEPQQQFDVTKRSEERRVGKECRSRCWPAPSKNR